MRATVPSPIAHSIEHAGWCESNATIRYPLDKGDVLGILGEWGEFGPPTVLGVDLFGTSGQLDVMERAVREAGIVAPVSAILSTAPEGGGMQLAAVSGIDPLPLVLGDRLVGFHFESEEARYCFLGGLRPSDAGAARERQTEAVFSTMEQSLALAGMDFSHVVRTWFYNDRILDWYPEFNGVRTGYFQAHEIRRMPASTGIGAANPFGTALVAKAHAVLPKDGVTIRTVRSPLQCDAFAYGSAFSRALEVADSHSRTLSISGTASIEPGGKSIHQGDPAAQIQLTMEVVNAILGEAGMKLEDATRVLAYFRNPSHMPLWEAWCDENHVEPLPLLAVGCHVCRDDLLFEIELDVTAPPA